MRIARILFLTLTVVALFSVTASAQQPFVAVYFDEFGTMEQKNCPGMGISDQIYIFAKNWNQFMTGFAFAVQYPPSVQHIVDVDKQPATIGQTSDLINGFSTAFAIPQNGFFPIYVVGVLIQWNCNGCAVTNDPIVVVPHPIFGDVQGTNFGTFETIAGSGLTALVCPTVPTEETTWGQVKALYGE